MISMIQHAFTIGHIDEHLAKILVVLIPKVEPPKQFKDLQPISLCKVVVKLISKVLVNRMRPFSRWCYWSFVEQLYYR